MNADRHGLSGIGVRTSRWKFVLYNNGRSELYELLKDPHELTNLVWTHGAPKVASALTKVVNDLRRCKGVKCRVRLPEEFRATVAEAKHDLRVQEARPGSSLRRDDGLDLADRGRSVDVVDACQPSARAAATLGRVVVEKDDLVWLDAQPLGRQRVDGGIGLCQADLVGVDDVVGDLLETPVHASPHERPARSC
jgi:hypothetical protein